MNFRIVSRYDAMLPPVGPHARGSAPPANQRSRAQQRDGRTESLVRPPELRCTPWHHHRGRPSYAEPVVGCHFPLDFNPRGRGAPRGNRSSSRRDSVLVPGSGGLGFADRSSSKRDCVLVLARGSRAGADPYPPRGLGWSLPRSVAYARKYSIGVLCHMYSVQSVRHWQVPCTHTADVENFLL